MPGPSPARGPPAGTQAAQAALLAPPGSAPPPAAHASPYAAPYPHAPPAPPEEKFHTGDTVALVSSLVSPMAAFFLFMYGFGAMNQSAPDTSAATSLYLPALLVVVGAAAAVAALGRNKPLRLGVAAAVGLPLGFAVATVAEAAYGYFGFFLFVGGPLLMLLMVLMMAYLGIAIASLVMLGVSGSRRAADVAACGGLGLAAAFATAAAYHLATLERQATLARDAFDIPGPVGPLLAILLLASAAWSRRRSATMHR